MKQRIRYFCLTLLVMVAGMASAKDDVENPVAQIGNNKYETLEAAVAAAEDGATIELLQDIDLSSAVTGTNRLPVSKSLTFNGKNHVITMGGRGFGVGMNAQSKVDVTFKDVTIKNTSVGARCIDTRGNIGTLTLEGVTLSTDGAASGDYTQPLTIGGNQSDAAIINIKNSTIQTNDAGTAYYAITTFNPVNMTISNSTIKGWACIYAKGKNGSAGSAGSVFTIENNSKIISSNAYSGVSNSFAAFMMEDNDVTINVKNSEITINNTGDQTQALAGYSQALPTGAVTLDYGTTVNFAGPQNCALTYNNANAELNIVGGTYNFNPSKFLSDGYKAVEDNGIWTVKEIVYVAQIGEEKYETLEAAFAAVKEDETVKLLGDVTLGGNLELALEGKNVTLDLGGKTLNGRTNLKSGNLTVKNGTVNCEGGQPLNVYGSATAGAENYSVLTVAEDVTVSGAYGVCLFGPSYSAKAGYGAVANIAGTLNGTDGTVFVSGNLGNNIDGDMNNVINITGKINGNNDAGVALNGNATVNVKKGAEITGNTGIAVKRGVLNVEDGATVHATGTENLNPDPNNNGTEMTGAAISMTDTYNNYGAMAVNITGGTFTSDNTVALFKEDGTYTNDATFSVSGGTFSSAVPAEFCAPGYMPTTKNKDDNTYSVTSVVMTVSAGTKTNVIENSGTIEVLNGESVTVYVTFTPDNISDKKAVFTIGDITKAGILSGLAAKEPKESGTSTSVRVKGLAEGETTLTVKPNAMADGAFVQTFTVKVLNNDVASVTGPDGNVTNYTSLEAALNAVPDGVDNEYTVTLLKDSKGKGIATNTTEADTHNKNIVLDLNGHTYTVTLGVGSTGSTNQAIHLNTGSKLTVKNGTIEAKPTVQSQVVMFGQIYGDLVLEDAVMDVTGIKATITTNQFNFNSGNATIKGNSEIKLRDGDFINVNLGSEDGNYPAGAKLDIQNITLATGTLKANGGSTAKETAGLTISGGTFNAVDYGTDVDASMINISGGTFNAPVPEQYCAEGYVPTDLGDGKYSVKKAPLAKIGETTYTSLADAFTAATDNQTITVLTDIDLPSTIAVNKQVTLDLAGKKIFNTSDLWAKDKGNWSFFSVRANGNLTVTGDGTIDAKVNDCYSFDVRNGGILTIKNGTFTGNISSVYLINEENIGVSTCNIEGGRFFIKQLANTDSDKYRYLLNCHDASYANNAAKFNVTGGSFVNFNPANNQAEGTETNFCAAGYEAVQDGNVWTVQKAPVAKIDDKMYYSLADAFAAATDGETITLLTNVELTDRLFVNAGAAPAYAGSNNRYATTSENKSITLDLNGNNITSGSNIALAGGSLNIVNTGTADADHGVISTSNNGLAPIEIRGTGDLTQKRTLTVGTGVTLSGAEYGLNVFGSNDAQKNVIDVNVNGTVNGTLFVLGNLKNAENEININVAGTVYVPDNGDDEASVGVALNGIATVNVNEGAQVSGETGIEVRAGNLVVNGGNITATASTYSEKKNGSGSCTEGAAVAVAQHTTKLPITATLNGGTLTGPKTLVVTDVEEIGLNDVTVKAADALAKAETVIIPAAYKWVSDGTMSTLTPRDPVAKIGEKTYYSLADAIAAVPANGTEATTITLLANVTENVVVKDGKNIVLDLDGKTLTGMIDQYDSQLNVTNGNVAGTVYVNGGPASAETGYNKFTLAADATITSDWGFILYQGPNGNDAYGSVIDINGTVNGTAWVMGNIKEGNSVINVNKGAKIQGSVFGLNGLATLNVKEGATIIGSETGIEVRAGNLNVEGGTITSTATEYSVNPNGSGTTTTGAAIAIAQHTTGLPINANIKGGTLSGPKTISVADPQGLNYTGVSVTAKDELTEGDVVIPEGYAWVSNKNGTSTLKKKEDAGDFELVHGEPYPCPNGSAASSITYRRTFEQKEVGNYRSWFVPFDYTIKESDAENFTFYKIHMVAAPATREGIVDNVKTINIYLREAKAGEKLYANRPYVIVAKEAKEYIFTTEESNLYAEDHSSRLHEESTEFNYDFYGTYREYGATKPHDWLALSKDGKISWNKDETANLQSYVWAVKVTPRDENINYSKINFVFIDEDNASNGAVTGVSSVSDQESEIEGIYNLNGAKVDHLNKGINIIKYKDGRIKKVSIK